MDKRFAIFDMDGTLVDSMGFWERLGREYLAEKGVTGDLDALMERTKPMTVTESAAFFLREFSLPGTPEDAAAELNVLMARHYRADVPAKPGVGAYLERLRRSGMRMCVASATAEPLMRDCLRRLGLERYFEFLLSCEEVGAGKDGPAVYFAAAARLGASPAETAVYEDALHALETAQRAGFYTVGVYDASGATKWDTVKKIANETIRDWREEAGA